MQMRGAVSVLVRGTVKSLIFFYLGFTALSRIFHLYRADHNQRWAKTGEPGEKPPDHQLKVWSEVQCSPRLRSQPASLHHCAGSFIRRVPLWGPLVGPLCRWPCIIAESLEECFRGSWLGKKQWKRKDRVNAGMTITICGTGLDLLQSSSKFPCAVCRTGVGSSSIFCNGCKHWVHKKCSGPKYLTKDPDYRCTYCTWGQRTAHPLEGRSQREVQVGPDKLKVVASFCYLGDRLSAAGGCELSPTTRMKTTWKKFKELLPVLSSCHLSFKTCGPVYNSCVWSAMLHASETWPLTKPNLQRLQRNDRAMIRQICNVRPQDVVTIRCNELLARLGTEDLDLILKKRRLRWYVHVEHSNSAVKTAFHI